MGEVTILNVEGPVATGGAVLDLALPLNSIIHSVVIFPIGASTEPTGVVSFLYEGASLETQVVPYGLASSGATYPLAVVEHPHLPLPKDRSYLLKTQIYNGSGADVIWRVVVIVEAV